MITLNEKRLRELEQRIPIYEATIAELKKKLEQVYAFPIEITELKKKNMSMAESMVNLVIEFGAYNQNNHVIFKTIADKLETHSNLLKEFRSGLGNIDSIVGGHTAHIADIRRQYDAFQKRYEDILKDIRGLIQTQVKQQNDIKTSQNAYELLQSIVNINRNTLDNIPSSVENLAEKMSKNFGDHVQTMSDLGKDIQGIKNQIAYQVSNLSSKMPEEKNYDAEIAEMKKDIGAILNLLHTTATAVPDQSPIDDKVKAMEKSIAQIFTLLKKYER